MTGKGWRIRVFGGVSRAVEQLCVGEFGYARRERANALTAGLDPILTTQEASPAVTIAATPDLFATPGRV